MRCTAKHERQATIDLLAAKDPWAAATTALRAASAPHASPAFGALYELVRREGRGMLRSFWRLDSARKDDLALATLDAALPGLLLADRPRAYFATALHRAAVSWRRSPRAAVVSTDADAGNERGAEVAIDGEERRALYCIGAREALAELDPRQREALLADAGGTPREDIAVAMSTSRANVDQLISRGRRQAQRAAEITG